MIGLIGIIITFVIYRVFVFVAKIKTAGYAFSMFLFFAFELAYIVWIAIGILLLRYAFHKKEKVVRNYIAMIVGACCLIGGIIGSVKIVTEYMIPYR